MAGREGWNNYLQKVEGVGCLKICFPNKIFLFSAFPTDIVQINPTGSRTVTWENWKLVLKNNKTEHFFGVLSLNGTIILAPSLLKCRNLYMKSLDTAVPYLLMLLTVSPVNDLFLNFLPQILTKHAVVLALEVMFLSQDPNIRIGFNSLCAYARYPNAIALKRYESLSYTRPIKMMQ
jgi:hypothetical protein